MALGFVIPVSVVANQKLEENIHLIGEDLFAMFLTVAILTSVLLLIIIFGKFIFCFWVIYRARTTDAQRGNRCGIFVFVSSRSLKTRGKYRN